MYFNLCSHSLKLGCKRQVALLCADKPAGVATDAFMPRRGKIQINLLFLSPCTNFAASEGRNPRVKNAFLAFTHVTKSPISTRGVETMQRSFCLYIHTSTALAVPHEVYTTAWGICFSVHSLDGVWRYQLHDELDKSLRFSCIYNQAQIINADFGRLVGKNNKNR